MGERSEHSEHTERTTSGTTSEPVELDHAERPIPTAGGIVRSQILPVAAIPLVCFAMAAVLMAAGVLTWESEAMGSLLFPSFFVGMLLQLWTRPARPRIALVQDRMEAGGIRRAALRRGTIPTEENRAKSAGALSCEDLELACLLTGTLVAAITLALLWPLGTLWVALPILLVLCIAYAVRAPRAWRYLTLLHGR